MHFEHVHGFIYSKEFNNEVPGCYRTWSLKRGAPPTPQTVSKGFHQYLVSKETVVWRVTGVPDA